MAFRCSKQSPVASTRAGCGIIGSFALHGRFRLWLPLLLAVLTLRIAPAAVLRDAQVDAYNVRVGTQTFAGLYQFTTNTFLEETALVIEGMGSDIIKLYLGSNWPRQYHRGLPSYVTNLVSLVRDEPSCRRVFDRPFRHVIAWAYPFGNPDAPFVNGYVPAEGAADYRELYDLTRYLLTNYNNSGKTFYLGHWEGDGYFMPWSTNPSPTAIQGMIAWLNNRQKAIDDARAATLCTNVQVFGYAEVNRVRDAMINGPSNNQRVINRVIPYVTNLDFISYSSYDAMNLGTGDLYATLDYIHSMLPTNKAAVINSERLFIGEYGWGGSQSPEQQEPTTRAYLQRLFNYGTKAMPFLLFWEVYNNETNKLYCLVDSNNVKVPCYYLHQRLINAARLEIARYQETNRRLPSSAEFVSLVDPLLKQSFPSAVALAVTNTGVDLMSGPSARVSAVVSQGIYGDDCAWVNVFYGRQDGGPAESLWESSASAGLNTNFNTAHFSVLLTNLAPSTNYFYRFCVTNRNGKAWSSSSGSFTTSALNRDHFGSRMRIVLSGYTLSQPVFDAPVLFRLGTNLAGFSYGQFASSSGADLRFAGSNGLTPLPFEIDEWNTNGTSLAWVRVPELNSSNAVIWAYWGNPLVTAPQSSTNGGVWNSDHHLVWHLKESLFPYQDSSSQHASTNGVAPANASGPIGRACSFNGLNQYLNGGAVDLGQSFTLSAWLRLNSAATNIQTIWANKAGGWNTAGFALYVNSYQTADGSLILETGNGVTGLSASTGPNKVHAGQWHHIAASIDRASSSVHLFVDGVDQTVATAIRSDFNTAANLNLGRFTNNVFFLQGIVDEARISKGTQGAAAIWASWKSGSQTESLFTTASVENQTPLLSFRDFGSGLNLAWPASGVGFELLCATNLADPQGWLLVATPATLANGLWNVELLPDPAGSKYFRLHSIY